MVFVHKKERNGADDKDRLNFNYFHKELPFRIF